MFTLAKGAPPETPANHQKGIVKGVP